MILILIPAYNEGEHLRTILPAMPATIGSIQATTIVASDGSTDDTVEVARSFGCGVLAVAVNRGKGATLRTGLAAAASHAYDVMVLMDGDGQHSPEDLERLVAPVLAGEADIVVGSRYFDQRGRGSTPWNRYAVRCATSAALRRILGQRFTDPFCGFRAMSREAASRLSLRGNRYQSELEMLFDAAEHSLRVVEVPIAKIYGPNTSKMGAHWGATIGRVYVLAQYTSTLISRSLRLRTRRAASRDEAYR